jgi:hypothetical protein
VGTSFSVPLQTGPEVDPASYTMGKENGSKTAGAW